MASSTADRSRLPRECIFIAVSGDSQPHFTTLAAFVSGMGDTVAKLFAQILLICDHQGLIGREMFAIDGVKLPSNASEDRRGSKNSIRLSNRTDNESAKMATSKGVVQGYTGVATVDEKAQIIVDAQAHGDDTVITADAGYHSATNLKALALQEINAHIPDNMAMDRIAPSMAMWR